MEVVQPPASPAVTSNSSSNPCSMQSNAAGASTTTIPMSPMNLEGLDKECAALAGLFQQVVNDMKVRN